MYFVTPRQLIFPGDVIATADKKVEGPVYLDNGRYRSLVVGLVEFREDSVVIVPLEGTYRPKKGDVVVGYVTDVLATGWEVDVRSFMPAYLPVSEALHKHVDLETTPLTTFLNVGDVIVAKVKDVDLTDEYPIVLTLREEKVGKVESGTVVDIAPVKIPRVIGKKGTMLNTLLELGCDIVVGQNGRIWIKCGDPRDEVFLASLIRKIELESHVMGLTDRVKSEIEKYKESKQK
ncbi:MAG: exosome complex RNA-binding protein Rrp4 [Pyrobaculum arsenaticum]|uniref:Exosome complex component Rrp4 n=3 Tax=Pyrobaculum TaxID=2276 RepID=A4WM66_PYRAR|nr:exosome complex RNA-binding protein Rrp4 [Pyrobaculum arsenaticum]ABP51483.1 ribosomal RNA-processing protein RRP4 [Pyrobaculum arsenaticum DSM 13514]AFA38214.1 RNA-binding protein Rrp4 and related proteins (containing S1 domain and KH domain) [Pyrobaculum oguniense TE7]MCY0890960.1 exosome complex RNA-binding protein Rrp4 [Pyrobaculum arsenaticum]NYR16548.1 RNA-binding protein [Pyrobaculum arsenaticum]